MRLSLVLKLMAGGSKADWYLNVSKQANGQRKMPKADDFANKDYSKGMNEDGEF